MSGLGAFAMMTLRSHTRRILGLVAFGLLFIAAGAVARVMTGGGEHGQVEMDMIFEMGGATLVSALLLLGWLVGRFPMIAALVLMQGVFSADRAAGYTRLYGVRPRSLVLLYATRFKTLAIVAFVLSALVLPLFDMLILGEWPDIGVFVLIMAQILVFGSVTAALSLLTRADAWLALFLAMVALVWDGLRRMDFFQAAAPLVREGVSVLLPPQGALMRIEAAFGAMQPVPWDAFLYIAMYATLLMLLTGVALTRREL